MSTRHQTAIFVTPTLQFLLILQLLAPISCPTFDPKPKTIDYEQSCDYEAHDFLFTQLIKIEQKTPEEALLILYPEQDANQQQLIDMADKICIDVSGDKVIDILKFDCTNDLKCTCGELMSQVDPEVQYPASQDPGREPKSGEVKIWYKVRNLNRRLVYEEGTSKEEKCVSGKYGHCTLPEYKDKRKTAALKCRKEYDCVPTFSGNNVTNKETGENYGQCRKHRDEEVIDRSSLGSGYRADYLMLGLSVSLTIVLLFKS